MADVAGMVFVTGGARSGKSSFSEALCTGKASGSGVLPAYLATAEAMDPEFALRIARHREERADRFRTWEEPLDIAAGVAAAGASHPVILLECVSTWLGNIFHHKGNDAAETFAMAQVESLASWVGAHPDHLFVVVSNEIGMGLVPADPTSRLYRDVHGRCNRRLAEIACQAWLVVSGLPQRLK